MPRIRTLKPEHRQHRKVGPLTDREYRLWVGMILEADDEGRLVCDAAQLRALIFAYQPKVPLPAIEAALIRLEGLGLIRLYCVAALRYADFPSWHDHQRIDRKQPSRLPMYEHSSNGTRMLVTDLDLDLDLDLEGKGKDHHNPSPRDEESATDWSTAVWPSPEALVHAYNTLTPDNVPAVRSLSVKRREKATKILRQFPERRWWEETFQRYHRSRFLSGRTTPKPGHEGFQPDFDWLLSNGQNGTENAVKVHDGNYR